MKWIMGMLLLPCLLAAQQNTRLDILPYTAYLTYQNTNLKESAWIVGMYEYFGYRAHHSFEGDVSYSKIRFSGSERWNPAAPIRSEDSYVKQMNLVLVYNNYQWRKHIVRLGGHWIIPGDNSGERRHGLFGSYVAFGGIRRYQFNKYLAGIDVYTSFYDNNNSTLNVNQINGKLGFYFGHYLTSGRFYAETNGSHIRLSEAAGFSAKRFSSIEQSLSLFLSRWQFQVFLFGGGQRLFAVQNDGFVVINAQEKHLGRYGAAVRYFPFKRISLSFQMIQGRFKEPQRQVVANYSNFVLMLGCTM